MKKLNFGGEFVFRVGGGEQTVMFDQDAAPDPRTVSEPSGNEFPPLSVQAQRRNRICWWDHSDMPKDSWGWVGPVAVQVLPGLTFKVSHVF